MKLLILVVISIIFITNILAVEIKKENDVECPKGCIPTNMLDSEKMTEEQWEKLKQIVEELSNKACPILNKGTWASASNGEIPKGAIISGWDPKRPYWVARSTIDGQVIPCKLTHIHATCWTPWNGTEYSMKNYEVLINADTKWVYHTSKERLPKSVVPAGKITASNGKSQILYVGRAYLDGMLVPGFVNGLTKTLRHSTQWNNDIRTNYEILVYL